MSYILEALKKSEARRRDRQAPDLTQEPPDTARGAGRWPLVVLTLLVLGAGSALGVWLATNRDAGSPTLAGQDVASPPTSPGAGAGQAGKSNTDTVAAKPEKNAKHAAIADRVRRAAGKSTRTNPGRKEPAPRGITSVTDSANGATPVATGATELPADDAPETATAQDLAAASPRAEPAPATAQNVADSGTRSSPLEDLTAQAGERFEATQAEPEEPPGPPLIRELAWRFRSQLPPLALNVHLYTEDPAQRFVLINMHRYQEGDLMENGNITVQRVVPEGVVLQLDGRDFLLGR